MTAPLTRFGFLTLRHFSMIAFTNAIEPLRMANYLAREDIYRWSVYSLDGNPVEASNGLSVAPTSPDRGLAAARHPVRVRRHRCAACGR